MAKAATKLVGPRISLNFSSASDFDLNLGDYGRSVGPRRGPFRRTANDREDWCIRRLLVAKRLAGELSFPFRVDGFDDEPGFPDYILTGERDNGQSNGSARGIEVVEATTASVQRGLTRNESNPIYFATSGIRDADDREDAGVDLVVSALERKVAKLLSDSYSAVGSCDLAVCFSEAEVPFRDLETLAIRVILEANNRRVDYRRFSHIHFVRHDEMVLLRADGDRRVIDVGSAYESDFFRWSALQAAGLRAGNTTGLDFVNLAEEIESLGKRDRRGVISQLERLILHLLKWRYQTAGRTSSWQRSIRGARRQIERVTDDSPSLETMIERSLSEIYPSKKTDITVLEHSYRRARKDAAEETGLPLERFPVKCPFSLDEILDEEFWPEKDRTDD